MQVVLNAIYGKLLKYEITAKAFVPKTDAEGAEDIEPRFPQELHLNHAHIRRQMDFLRNYLLKIMSNEDWEPTSKLWIYMDKVAIAHTGVAGFAHRAKRPELRVEYMHLGLLLGYVEDVVVGAVMGMEGIDLEIKGNVVRAWNKLLWLQNDLFARRYVVDRDTGETPIGWEVKVLTSSRISNMILAVLGFLAGMLIMYTFG